MNRSAAILGLTLLIEPLLAGSLYAQRTAHRPWLSRRSEGIEAASPARASRRVARTPRRSAKTESPAATSPTSDVASETPTTFGEKIVEQAKRYHGVRYRFGGDSKSKGFDCSGLIRRVYNDLNFKSVPRTSAALYQKGTPVRSTELRPGDLVFFKNTYKRGISHVGVYAGRNKFIHAQSSRRGVTMTSLAEPYYQLHYAGARRLY
jgi:cell wall-associated NlpC family hydrolase